MSRQWDVVVIGAGGSQAQAMIEGAARATPLTSWLAVDRAWRPEAAAALDALGMPRQTLDLFEEPDRLRGILADARVVANLAGPYYRTGSAVLTAAITAGADYLDICDDADAVLGLLGHHDQARQAGITALVGMGSSPGTTNVLIRAAVDYLGNADSVDIYWTVDIGDMTPAAVRHFWHCFNLVDPDGTSHPVPSWDDLDRVVIDFPGSVGTREVVRLAHPEPLTVPKFLPVNRSRNYGSITPDDAMRVAWSLAYAVAPDRHRSGDSLEEVTAKAVDVFAAYRDSRPDTGRVGSGLVIDIHTDGNGLRFSSGAETEMAEATGIPAAAGLLLLADGRFTDPGVRSPEHLQPADFFASLRTVSRGGGGLQLHRLENGVATERVRIRDLIATPARAEA